MANEQNELTPQYLYSLIKANAGKIESLEKKQARTSRTVKDIEEEYPLLPPEADDLSNAVKRKGVEVLGGKKSSAYADKDLRGRVYRDIYGEVKRQYGLINERGGQISYKKLKRKHLSGALDVVEQYVAPTVLCEEIESLNDLDGMMD